MKIALDKLKWFLLAIFFWYLDIYTQKFLFEGKDLKNTVPALIAVAGLVLVLVLVFILMKLLKEPLSLKAFKDSQAALYMIGFPAAIGINLTGGVIRVLLNGSADTANQNALNNSGMPFYLLLVFGILFAPILEELIFRKCLLEKVFGFGRWKWLGLAVTSFLFGYVHLISDLGNIGGWVSYTGIGLVFGYVLIWSKRIEYSIAIHILMNVLVFLMQFLATMR
ncbi:CPBP family intramembrane glutamic endopeptidase [Streptococcus dentapri]|uniref:CPBP family intramembrane glutamic endopeptidase n=1 Tax=Streptococcus dentapri TaxID=573564 RepID=A0ABV8CZT4_9STRE